MSLSNCERKALTKRLGWALIILAIQPLYFLSNRPAAHVNTLYTVIDRIIPFNSYFAFAYYIWYFYFIFIIIFLARVGSKYYYRYLAAYVTGYLLCFGIFNIYKVGIDRPQVLGSGFTDYMVRFIYNNDPPYNCFPSIHVMVAVLAMLFFASEVKSVASRVLSGIICILIILSTMFIKQHYFLDALSGAALAVILYLVFSKAEWPIRRRSN